MSKEERMKGTSSPPPDPAALVEQYRLVQGEPCPNCACQLYRTNMYHWPDPVCVRCFPARGYHEWSDQVDALFPRKRTS